MNRSTMFVNRRAVAVAALLSLTLGLAAQELHQLVRARLTEQERLLADRRGEDVVEQPGLWSAVSFARGPASNSCLSYHAYASPSPLSVPASM